MGDAMCGIVGLFLKDPSLEPQLGALLAEMLGVMTDRGPDSAGFAVYGGGRDGFSKLTLRGSPASLAELAKDMGAALGAKIESTPHDTHLVVSVPSAEEPAARRVRHAS